MEVTEQQVEELQGLFCPFGILDLKAAIEHGQKVNLTPLDIFDLINEARECVGFKQFEAFENVDPVYCVLEHILQMAKNKIEDVTGYDFQCDFHGDTEFYTYGNFMCSDYDYSAAAKDDLIDKLDNLSTEQLRQLRESLFVCAFLDQVEIDIIEPA